jgi:hypothetical protein
MVDDARHSMCRAAIAFGVLKFARTRRLMAINTGDQIATSDSVWSIRYHRRSSRRASSVRRKLVLTSSSRQTSEFRAMANKQEQISIKVHSRGLLELFPF